MCYAIEVRQIAELLLSKKYQTKASNININYNFRIRFSILSGGDSHLHVAWKKIKTKQNK
jgi:hypothetical protein